ncbi:MAG: SDR family oxidoreductase [Planctomycetes bacterium]|nr:SDR family oxidoreductase [Planctomycetota bacterium]
MSGLRQGAGRSALIFGATSPVARALAREFARCGYELFLAGRAGEDLEAVASDLRIRHRVSAHACPLDALAFETHAAFFEAVAARTGESLYVAVFCIGSMSDQKAAERDWDAARAMLDTNYTAAVSLLERTAAYFEPRKRGVIGVVGSVAGDRGRQSNYLYGSAKAGLAAYAQGLRNRLWRSGVQVTTIKPGFLDTRMTWGKPGLFGVATPERAAEGIFAALAAGRDVAYVPGFWRGIMLLIGAVPERVFKRLKL